MAEELGSMYSKCTAVGDMMRVCIEENGRDCVLWAKDGLVISYSSNSSEEWCQKKAEEAGLRWNDGPDTEKAEG